MRLRLTAEGVRRARGWAQLLAGTGAGDVTDVTAALVGIQGQDLSAAGLCARARTSGLVTADVQSALSETRSVVLTWSLRGTRHLHDRADVRPLLGLLGPVFARPGRRADQLGVGGPTGAAAVRALAEALAAEGTLDRAQVRARLGAVGVEPTGQAPVHVLHRAALEGVLCVVPVPGGGERYVLLDEWVPAAGAVDVDRFAADLARRYLAAYGPATLADFATWSGLPARPARTAWTSIAAERTDVGTPDGTASVLAASLDEVATVTGRPLPLRLTGGFDTLWLGYADRSLLVDGAHAARVNPGGGMVRPLVVGDGRVVGTWAYRRRGRTAHVVEVDLFRALTRSETAAVEAEVVDVGRFVGTSPSLVLHDR